MMKRRLETLEFLRATCALIVLLNHCWGEGRGLPHFAPIDAVASYSIEAVMGFFVLSGCVISLQDYPDIGRYVRARLIRVLPVYYAALALALAGMAVCAVDFRTSQLVGNLFFLQTLDWKEFDPLRFFIPSWSLSYEFYYYAIFIAILAMPRLVLPLMLASVLAGGALYLLPTPAPPQALWPLHALAFFGMWLAGVQITRLCRAGHAVSIGTGTFLLMVGLCLARVSFTTPSKFDYFRLAAFSVGFSFFVWSLLSDALLPASSRRSSLIDLKPATRIAIAAVVLSFFWWESDSFRSTRIVLTAGVIVGAAAPTTLAQWVGRALRPTLPFMLYVAGLSYALYLVHYPLVQASNSLALLPPLASFAVVVLASFGLAHLLEYRFQAWVRARLASHKPATASSSNSNMRT